MQSEGLELDKSNSLFAASRGLKVHNVCIEECVTKKKYDLIHMTNAFNYFTDPLLAMQKVRSMLSDAGVFVMQDKDYLFSPLNPHNNFTNNAAWIQPRQYLTYASIYNLLRLARLEIVHYKRRSGRFILIAVISSSSSGIKTSSIIYRIHLVYLRNIRYIDKAINYIYSTLRPIYRALIQLRNKIK